MEQEEYTKEEIDWSYIEFVDNQDILDLIEKVCVISVPSLFSSEYLYMFLIPFNTSYVKHFNLINLLLFQ